MYHTKSKILGGALLLLIGWLSQPLQAQHQLVTQTQSLYQYKNGSGNAAANLGSLEGKLQSGEFKSGAVMVKLDLSRMQIDEPMLMEIDGKQYPIIKDQLWINPENAQDYSVRGYLMGDPSLPFFYLHPANGHENLSFHTPEDKYFFSSVGDNWFLRYSLNPAFQPGPSCVEYDTPLEAQSQEEDARNHSQKSNAGDNCRLRVVFLWTDLLENELNGFSPSIGASGLENMLDQNLHEINSQILANGNGRNPRITHLAGEIGCTYQIEKVALIKAHGNAYGTYNEPTCPATSNNGIVMQGDMINGLSGVGPLAWLQDLRKDYAADMIVLLTSSNLWGSSSCNNGASLNGIAGGIDVNRNASILVQRAVRTFITSSGAANPTNYTLIHEIGHNLGCNHEEVGEPYQGYCHKPPGESGRKTIMHTLFATNSSSVCDGGVTERRPVFSHNDNTLEPGVVAGYANYKNADKVGYNFDDHAEFFEDGNWGTNNLTYSLDFANNSGRTRYINTNGYVDFHNARNSGSNYVVVKTANYVYVRGSFSSERISFKSIPNNAPFSSSIISFAAKEQISQLESTPNLADHLFAVTLAPNPATEHSKLYFFLSQDSDVSVELYELSGKKVRDVLQKATLTAGDQQLELPVHELPEGMYLVRIASGDEHETLRLFVTH